MNKINPIRDIFTLCHIKFIIITDKEEISVKILLI